MSTLRDSTYFDRTLVNKLDGMLSSQEDLKGQLLAHGVQPPKQILTQELVSKIIQAKSAERKPINSAASRLGFDVSRLPGY